MGRSTRGLATALGVVIAAGLLAGFSPATAVQRPTAATSISTAALTPPRVSGLTWYPRGRMVNGRHPIYVATTAGGRVSLMWMDPTLLRFRFIPGFRVPENSPIKPADRSPSTWVPYLAAAFNGGFMLSDDVGGYWYYGTRVKSLRAGYATLAIDTSSRLRVGVWGSGTMTSTTGMRVLRQNMRPLVRGGVAQAGWNDDPAKWGSANGGLPTANRSAVGQLLDGSIVFAYGYEVRASVVASALVKAKVRTAIALDMNKSWPTGFYYDAPKSGRAPVGHKIASGIVRDPSEYYAWFQKDFVVAMVPH